VIGSFVVANGQLDHVNLHIGADQHHGRVSLSEFAVIYTETHRASCSLAGQPEQDPYSPS
jgi:hypothetical protein